MGHAAAQTSSPSYRTETTDEDGEVLFQWKPGNANAVSTIVVSETPEAGYTFEGWECKPSKKKQLRRPAARGFKTPERTITLQPGEFETCTALNRKIPNPTGTITIIKEAVPNSDREFAFSGSGGLGSSGSWTTTTLRLPPPRRPSPASSPAPTS